MNNKYISTAAGELVNEKDEVLGSTSGFSIVIIRMPHVALAGDSRSAGEQSSRERQRR